MLYDLIRALLFRLDAERAHEIAMSLAQFVAHNPSLAELIRDHLSMPAPDEKMVAGLRFPNRIGLAAGMDKNAVAPLAWWAFGFGLMELGTVTPLPQSGKPRPRMFRFPDRRAIVNRMGFNNAGAEAVARHLAWQRQMGLRPPCPIGLSVGKNALTPAERAADDYRIATQSLAPFADYIAINVSSPNTAGLRRLQGGDEIRRILRETRRAAGAKPVFVKIAPELEEPEVRDLLDVCLSEGAAGIIATNTLATANMQDLPEGGLSGLPLRERALALVRMVRKVANERIALIGCGGIDDADSAQRMFDAGADLVQLYTGLVYRGPFLPAKISRELARRNRQQAHV